MILRGVSPKDSIPPAPISYQAQQALVSKKADAGPSFDKIQLFLTGHGISPRTKRHEFKGFATPANNVATALTARQVHPDRIVVAYALEALKAIRLDSLRTPSAVIS